MDINQLYTVDAHEAGAEMKVKDQLGKELDCFITIAGIDSKSWRQSFSKQKKKLISGDDDNASADLYTGVTLGWRGFVDSEGKEVKFSKAAIKKLYVNAPYLVEQVDRFIADRANFTKG